MAELALERVSKRFRRVEAVSDVSLQVTDGEFLVLLGPSGCGKTTVLRLIAGLEVPDSGLVRFDGEDMTGVPPSERNIAMVFEGFALYPHFAVRDNLAFALRLRHLPGHEVERRVADVATAMDLGHLLARRPPGLATGEAQQVAVGRAVIREAPSVLLLDDALAHLDAQQRLEARAELGHLHRDLGCTVVSVTHDQTEAMALGQRIAVMDEGRLVQVGTPETLYRQPVDVFVAGFIGSPPMNLFPMDVDRRDGRVKLRQGELEIEVPEASVAGSMRVVLGIRPEDIRLGPAVEGAVGIRGSCDLVEYVGPRLLVHLRVGGADLVLLDDPSDHVRPGDHLECAVPLERLHLFDEATGRALTGSPAGALPV